MPIRRGESWQICLSIKWLVDDGRGVRLVYKPLGTSVRVELTVTSPTKVRIEGNYGIESFEVDIK